tara:strand:+ start:341 stop:523 length:183 start_codon:yes stop_codon:yes gene_type:complete
MKKYPGVKVGHTLKGTISKVGVHPNPIDKGCGKLNNPKPSIDDDIHFISALKAYSPRRKS